MSPPEAPAANVVMDADEPEPADRAPPAPPVAPPKKDPFALMRAGQKKLADEASKPKPIAKPPGRKSRWASGWGSVKGAWIPNPEHVEKQGVPV